MGSLLRLRVICLRVLSNSSHVLLYTPVLLGRIQSDISRILLTSQIHARRNSSLCQLCRILFQNTGTALASSTHPHLQALGVDKHIVLRCDSDHSSGKTYISVFCPRSIGVSTHTTPPFDMLISTSARIPSVFVSRHWLDNWMTPLCFRSYLCSFRHYRNSLFQWTSQLCEVFVRESRSVRAFVVRNINYLEWLSQ